MRLGLFVDALGKPAGRFGSFRIVAASMIALVMAASGMPSAAQARVGDRDWARCVWERAPVSAHNWVGMPLPTWQDNMATATELLGLRLVAVCIEEAADEMRPNRRPNWRALKSALRSARPRQLGAADAATPVVELCRNYIRSDGTETLYRADVVQATGERRMTVYQQYFGDHQGQMLRMPQDLRIVPPAGTETHVLCQAISNSGELEGA